MYDWLWATIKIGDQQTAMGKYHLGVKDGMVVDFVDPNDPSYGPDYFPSEWMRTVFLNVKVPYQYKDNLKNWVMPVGDETDTENYRARGRLIRFGEFPLAAQNKIRNALDKGKVLDLTQQYAAWLFPDGTRQESSTWTSNAVKQLFVSSSVLNPPAVDDNAISSGSYTVGSDVGDDYATLAAAVADLANLTGDLTLTVSSSSITETAGNNPAISLGGHCLTFTSAQYSGNPNTDYRVDCNFSGSFLFDFDVSGPGEVCIEGIFFKWTGTASINNRVITVGSAPTGYTMNIRDCMFDGVGGNGHRAVDVGMSGVTFNHSNNIAWDWSNIGFRLVSVPHTVENCVATGCVNGFNFLGSASTVRNCIAFGNSGAEFVNISACSGYNNASDDATAGNANWSTGSGNITSLNTATAFESITDTDGDNYLLPAESGALYGAGSNPTIGGHDTYINGVDIVTDDVDIGAKGLERSGDHNHTTGTVEANPGTHTKDYQMAHTAGSVEATPGTHQTPHMHSAATVTAMAGTHQICFSHTTTSVLATRGSHTGMFRGGIRGPSRLSLSMGMGL